MPGETGDRRTLPVMQKYIVASETFSLMLCWHDIENKGLNTFNEQILIEIVCLITRPFDGMNTDMSSFIVRGLDTETKKNEINSYWWFCFLIILIGSLLKYFGSR